MTARIERIPLGEISPRARQCMVAMRDDVRLATDVYLPGGGDSIDTPLPAVLVRLPYDKTSRFSFMDEIASRFNAAGYVFVAQDVRGKARSEGERLAFVHERDDGHDTIDWIAGRGWCDGRVGMFGDSYYGFTQWAAAASGHPALKAIVPRVTSSFIPRWMGSDSVPELHTGVGWAANTYSDAECVFTRLDWTVRPLVDVIPEAHDGARCATFDQIQRHGKDGAGWSRLLYGSERIWDHIELPILHVGGWWDNFRVGQIDDYLRMRATGAAGQQFLIMDATDHFDTPFSLDGPPDRDPLSDDGALAEFLPVYLDPAIAFFDRFLAGRTTIEPPRVRWHLPNAGWRTAEDWPPAGLVAIRWYLGDGDAATAGADGGTLAPEPDPTASTTRWTHDPTDLVPDLEGDPWHPLLEGLPDECEVESRPDVATYTTAPVEDPLDLVGPVTLGLDLDTTAPSTHVIAKLVDVQPDGRALRVAFVGRVVEDPGAPVVIDVGPVAYRFLPGHRLRLELASSRFPHFVPHPGTDADPWEACETSPSTQTITVGANHPSWLDAHVLPGG
ncbi:MAG: CocE/NonD family hydrolase [Actinomycetota bacterium]|nr:CocE/NonD family hydrolase [Actinomycetota bacterium]